MNKQTTRQLQDAKIDLGNNNNIQQRGNIVQWIYLNIILPKF